MIDWFVLLGALALLPAIALLYFVGCGKMLSVNETSSTPPTSGGGTPAPGPAPAPGPLPGGPVVPPPPALPPRTILQLKLAPDLNIIPMGGRNDKVDSVVIAWTLKTKPPAPPAVDLPLDEMVVRIDGTRNFIDPAFDPPATRVLSDDEVKRYGTVTWKATVSTKDANNLTPSAPSPTTESPFDILSGSQHVFRLSPVWTPGNLNADPRRFSLVGEPTMPSPAVTGPPTRLQLNMAPTLNVIPAGGRAFQAISILVTWTLKQPLGGRPDQALHQTIVRVDPARKFLDPAADQSAMWDLSLDQTANYSQVTCVCRITCGPVMGTATPETSTTNNGVPYPVNLAPGKVHVFLLSPDWTNPGANPRVFTVALAI